MSDRMKRRVLPHLISRMVRTTVPRLLVLVLAAAACADTAANRTRTAQVDTLPGGRVQVTNTGAPAWTPETAWRLEEDLRLGSAATEGPEQFGRITAVLADSLGMIYALDTFSQEIRVFHPDGAFSHTIGRKGEGPGELMMAAGMTFGPGDSLWVTDPRANRYSAFARDGTFLTSHPRQMLGYILSSPGTFVSGGRYVDWGLGFPDERPGVVAGARVVLHPIRFAAGFEGRDSLPPLVFNQEMMLFGNYTVPAVFFDSRLTLSLDRGGSIWFAHTREYRIHRRTLEGDTTLVFTLPAEPAPVGEAERAYVRERVANRPELLAAYLEALPETKPIVHRILSDGAGHIFVFPEVVGVPGGSVVDVFRESGEFLGRLTLPAPVPLSPVVGYATPEHLYLVVTDALDVPYVSRLRIVRPG